MSTDNPYVPPQVDVDPVLAEPVQPISLWRQRDLLVAAFGSDFPDRCPLTNLPATTRYPYEFSSLPLVLKLFLIFCGVGIWLTRHALAMFRMQATLSNRGLACVTQTWGVWRGRKIVERDLTWNQIQGVRVISYPNPYADGGVEHNFVVHTDQETLNFSTMMWPEAATIVDTILANIGKQLDELPEEAKAADVPKGVGSRVADVCMRGLGWLAIGMGALSTIGMVALVFSKEAKDWGAIGTLSVVTGTLFTAGRALTRWRSSGIQATRDATAAS